MLRTLISLTTPQTGPAWIAPAVLILLGVLGSVASGEEDSDAPTLIPEFAPGAQGQIAPSIPTMLNDAEALARSWEERLDIQSGADFAADIGIDLDEMRMRALNHPRVRALLDADAGQGAASPEDEPRYASDRVFLFASFSIPDPSLRAMMNEANALGVPVLFNGFVNNSVHETRERLLDVFGSDENIIGFSIDPTMFVRFDIKAVPAVVMTAEPVAPCYTAGCAGDGAPPHDIVRGNIPLIAALDISARGGGDGSQTAIEMRAKWEDQR